MVRCSSLLFFLVWVYQARTQRVDILRGLLAVVVAVLWVQLHARVEFDRALQEAELHAQLLGGVVADEQLSDVQVHREVRGQQVPVELLHVRHHLRGARRRGRCADPRCLADRLLAFCDSRRIVPDPSKSWKSLAERAAVALVLVLALQLVDDFHAEHLRRRVPRGADGPLVVRLRDQNHAGAHVALRAFVSVALQNVRAGWKSFFVAGLSTETNVRVVRVEVAEVEGDRTPQRLRRALVRSCAFEFSSSANMPDHALWRRGRRYRVGA